MKKVISMLILSLGLAQVAFANDVVKTEVKEAKVQAVESKTMLGWLKSHPKTATAIVAAALATAGTGAYILIKCPKDKGYLDFTKETGKYVFVELPKTAWKKLPACMQNHPYIVASGAVVATAISVDLLRGEKSIIKKTLFAKQDQAKKEVEAALAK